MVESKARVCYADVDSPDPQIYYIFSTFHEAPAQTRVQVIESFPSEDPLRPKEPLGLASTLTEHRVKETYDDYDHKHPNHRLQHH